VSHRSTSVTPVRLCLQEIGSDVGSRVLRCVRPALCAGSIPPSSTSPKNGYLPGVFVGRDVILQCTSNDVPIGLSRGFAVCSAGGNSAEPYSRPSANCLVGGGVHGRGRERACGVPEPGGPAQWEARGVTDRHRGTQSLFCGRSGVSGSAVLCFGCRLGLS